ncbi:MAG: DUF1289 domain-containing protein [Gammaproteobacteria bacterium]|nr:DUF1289 domain-containing protein [Gammaproteobacteria bacterium]
MSSTKPESPCIRRCTLDPETDICLGCYRTLQEILGWQNYSTDQRLAVLEKLADRKNTYALKRRMLRSQKDLK